MKLLVYLLAMICLGVVGCVAIYARFAVVLACIGGTFVAESVGTIGRLLTAAATGSLPTGSAATGTDAAPSPSAGKRNVAKAGRSAA